MKKNKNIQELQGLDFKLVLAVLVLDQSIRNVE